MAGFGHADCDIACNITHESRVDSFSTAQVDYLTSAADPIITVNDFILAWKKVECNICPDQPVVVLNRMISCLHYPLTLMSSGRERPDLSRHKYLLWMELDSRKCDFSLYAAIYVNVPLIALFHINVNVFERESAVPSSI